MRNLGILSTRRIGRAACLAVLALALWAGEARAGSAVSAPAPLGWSFRGFFRSNLTRTRAIQGAALFMALGLFILMRKFDGSGGR